MSLKSILRTHYRCRWKRANSASTITSPEKESETSRAHPASAPLALALVVLGVFLGLQWSDSALPPVAQAVQEDRAPRAIPSSAPAATSAAGVQTGSLINPALRQSVALSRSELATIAKYDLVVLLDRSGSMTEFDCPLSDILTSRWDWSSRQLEKFAGQTANVFPRGFTIVTFNNDAERFDNCKPNTVAKVCRLQTPAGDAQLANALTLALAGRGKNSEKPLAVIVLTDGLPDDQAQLEGYIQQAASKDNNSKFCFLAVGNAPAGDHFLNVLTKQMQVSKAINGGRFSMVSFKQLRQMGLGHVIAQTLSAIPK